jgi:hypothetical protein
MVEGRRGSCLIARRLDWFVTSSCRVVVFGMEEALLILRFEKSIVSLP